MPPSGAHSPGQPRSPRPSEQGKEGTPPSPGLETVSSKPDKSDNVQDQLLGGRYRVLGALGSGGMGTVYEAEHVDIGRRMAIKILHASFNSDPELVKRFRREARAASQIGHPNIIEVTDFGTTADGCIFFVMELLHGQDLAQLMAETPQLPLERTLDIGLQICGALHAAHEARVVHRDLKPENIFLIPRDGRDVVKVLDFGVAMDFKQSDPDRSRLTSPGKAMGTPEYMSPEQATGAVVDRRADVYAASVMLYEMITGRLPYQGATLLELLRSKARDQPKPPSHFRSDVPTDLEAVLMKGLLNDPQQRPQTMLDLCTELQRCKDAWVSLTQSGATPASVPDASLSESAPTTPEMAYEDTRLRVPAAPLVPSRPGGIRRAWLWASLIVALGGLSAGAAILLWKPAATQPTQSATTAPDQRPSDEDGVPSPGASTARSPEDPKHIATVDNKRRATPSAPSTAAVSVKVPAVSASAETSRAETKLSLGEVERLLEWAKRAASNGRFTSPKGDNVRDLLARIDRDYPTHEGARKFRTKTYEQLLRKARRLQRRHRYDGAAALYEASIALFEKRKIPRIRLARLHLMQGRRALARHRYPLARQHARQALAAMPGNIRSLELLGDIAARRRQFKSAAKHFQAALDAHPKSRRHRKLLQRKLRKAKRRS